MEFSYLADYSINLAVIMASIFVLTSVGFFKLGERKSANDIDLILESKRNQLLVKGEQIGYIKGFEAGTLTSRLELKNQFISFLEEQLKVMKSQTPAGTAKPKPQPPKPVEQVRGGL